MSLVSDYLIHSYLYYELDTSIISDEEFNHICKQLLSQLPVTHIHAHLVDPESLKASTGFGISFPSVVKDSAIHRYFTATNGHNPYTDTKLSLADTLILHRSKAYQ